MSKQLNTRIQLKHDFEVNWIIANDRSGFVPRAGELIIYDPEVDDSGKFLVIDGKTASLPSGRTSGYTYARTKIGDGKTKVTNLPFFVDDAIYKQVSEILVTGV